jgi:DNA modification methylase
MEEQVKLMLGDNLESLKQLEDNSVDSVVTDPPYGLSFMNKKWDHDVPSVEFWKEVYRVLKPGGHVLSFGGTRTYHRMVVNIEDAGFEIRDQIMWLYGSGFPKSHNIGKAVDKIEGNEREVVGKSPNERLNKSDNDSWDCNGLKGELNITKGTSPYEGWGTALKPANEPICLARKPLSEKSVAENVLKWGTGGINIDGCRVGTDDKIEGRIRTTSDRGLLKGTAVGVNDYEQHSEGRFPANIILECICDEVIKGEKGEVKKAFPGGTTFGGDNKMNKDVVGTWFNDKGDIHTNPMCPCRLLDEQSGISNSIKSKRGGAIDSNSRTYNWNNGDNKIIDKYECGFNDKGGASRFFYVAKVSKKERNLGLDHFEDELQAGAEFKPNHMEKALKGEDGNPYGRYTPTKNVHPTIKPINLMTYLCRLVTPEGGIVLDPFMGSGSTGIATRLEGFRFVGMEMDPEYFKIAETRINNYEDYRQFLK